MPPGLLGDSLELGASTLGADLTECARDANDETFVDRGRGDRPAKERRLGRDGGFGCRTDANEPLRDGTRPDYDLAMDRLLATM
jgi:hypothetical protein